MCDIHPIIWKSLASTIWAPRLFCGGGVRDYCGQSQHHTIACESRDGNSPRTSDQRADRTQRPCSISRSHIEKSCQHTTPNHMGLAYLYI